MNANPMNAVQHYRRQHDDIKARLPGQGVPWLSRSRAAALRTFTDLGFPTTRAEDWKYTDVRPLEKRRFTFADAALDAPHDAAVAPALETAARELDARMAGHVIAFVDGRYCPPLSSAGQAPAGVTVKDLATALADGAAADADPLRDHLGKIADPEKNGFAALNFAFRHAGAVIHIADNAALARPIHLLFLDRGERADATSQLRVLILAGANSQSQIVETYHALGENVYFNNVTTEVKLAPNARLEHYKTQQESRRAFHVYTLQAEQARDSMLSSYSLSFGGYIERNDINVRLAGEGAACNLYGLYVTGGRQHTDFHTRIDHAVPHCTSNELYKGVLYGHSRSVFNGQVHIHPDAQKSAAELHNNNLLLSEHAEIDTKPQLEIYADDVTAAHGATVGQIDDNMMFYLRSRGIDYDTAYALLVYGFAHDIAERMTLRPLSERLERLLLARIANADKFGK